MFDSHSLHSLDSTLLGGAGMLLPSELPTNPPDAKAKTVHSVARALQARDGTRAVLQGRVVLRIGEYESLFEDATGRVEVLHDGLPGRFAATIQLEGVVRRDRQGVRIDVEAIQDGGRFPS